jgi:hypothetical protein
MKSTAFLALVIGGIATQAHAGRFELRLDPSGAPMCFAADGQKAQLHDCDAQLSLTYVTRFDPSGSPMCFAYDGTQALLSHCRATLPVGYTTVLDPSGAPMCFSSAGDKALLTRCQPEIALLSSR